MNGVVIFVCFLFFTLTANAGYIVKTKMANLRKEPNSKSEVVYKLYQYEDVKIIKTYGEWVKVKTIDGYIGWVHKSVIEKLEDNPKEDKSNTKPAQTLNSDNQKSTQSNESNNSSNVFILQNEPVSQTHQLTNKPEVSSAGISNKSLVKEYKFKDTLQRRRVIGDHIFPSTVLFPTPIPSARFGFSQGFLNKKGEYIDISDDDKDGIIQSTEITKNKYNYAGLSEIFDSQIVIHENVSFDLNANIILSGGMEKKDFTSVKATPGGDIRIGPSFSYKLENNLLLSFGLKYYLHKGINVSASYGIDGMINVLEEKIGDDEGFRIFLSSVAAMPEDQGGGEDPENIDSINEWLTLISSDCTRKYLSDAIKGFTQNIVVNNTKTALSPSLGFAYPITKYLGVQGIIEYQKIKDKYSSKVQETEVDYNKLDYGLATSVDFRHLIGFPLGISLEYFREKYELEKTNNIAFSTYYQGNGDIQLGLTLKTSKTDTKKSEITYKDSYTQKINSVYNYLFLLGGKNG